MSEAEEIGTRIASLLKERYPGMPRRRICAEANVSYKTLSDALAGKTVPRYSTAERLAEYLDVSVNYIFTGEEEESALTEEERLRTVERQISELSNLIEKLTEKVAEDDREHR
jgi:transcriptional regulator with XRE-family HTH domain